MERPHSRRNAFKWFWAVADLSARREEKALLWPLALHADSNGTSFPGEALLCRESGIGNERTLRRVLRRLERAGWIETARNSRPVRIEGRTFYANSYRLTLPTRADIIVSPHEGETGGHRVKDGRTNQARREDKSGTTGGHSRVRRTTKELPEGMSTEPRKEQEQPRIGNLGFSIGKIIGGGNGQDRYERIANLRQDELADYAADFCGEAKQPRTVAAFKRFLNIIGPEAFRSKLVAFVGEVAAGEEPRNRGAAFMARLKTAVEARKQRAGK